MRLGQAELGRGLPSESQCLCGCAGCAAVCDGYGPIMGVTTAPDEVAAMLIDVGAHMPDAGMFGLYIRARGVANFNVVLFKGDTTDLTMLDEQLIADPIYPVVSLGREFKEHVLYRDIGIKPYAWATAADKPTLVAIIPVGADGNALALAELDCIVPFVTPSEQISRD
jgi:hypothetical protein